MTQSFIFIVLLLLLDWYVFQAVKAVNRTSGNGLRTTIYILYWTLSALTLLALLAVPYLRGGGKPPVWASYTFSILIGVVIAKLVAVTFFIADDLRRVIQWAVGQIWIRNHDAAPGHEQAEAISRSAFLSWLGIGVGSTLFGTMLFGFRNQYNYQVRRVALKFPNLPQSFSGLKVVHISDIHSGSFMNRQAVEKGVAMINGLRPDLILFTGDLVNDRATEMEPYMDVFNQLKAPLGVYSTLGNHDYGDYAAWQSLAEKQANLEKLKSIHGQMGWRLLLDECVAVEKNGETIGLLGVQNISGKASFHSYGSLEKAYANSSQHPFKLLMSHDPSHWDAEVRANYPDINLTLSGHTHGMQFGIEVPGFKWSPVQWMYRQWAGLYEAGTQKLYVNRGFGFIGYPGRVGILPEITLLELT